MCNPNIDMDEMGLVMLIGDGEELAEACVDTLASSCSCDEAYTCRNRIDPSCEWCNISKFIVPLAKKFLEKATYV